MKGLVHLPHCVPPKVSNRFSRKRSVVLCAKGDKSENKDASTPKSAEIIFPDAQPAANLDKRVGLHRTPLSGGVQNATARNGLPPPAVGVRNLLEQAQYAQLCSIMSNMHHRRAGYPFGTLVDFATDGAGAPIFCLSPLAIHTRNIVADPRCSLVVQMPGWSGLANARVTIFGDVYQLPAEMQEAARELFNQKNNMGRDKWVQGNFTFFRMHRISDIYFVGGFGTVQWVDVREYANTRPDEIVLSNVMKTLQVMNERYGEAVRALLSTSGNQVDDVVFISVDRFGTDIRIRRGAEYSVERITFDTNVRTCDEACLALDRMTKDRAAFANSHMF